MPARQFNTEEMSEGDVPDSEWRLTALYPRDTRPLPLPVNRIVTIETIALERPGD